MTTYLYCGRPRGGAQTESASSVGSGDLLRVLCEDKRGFFLEYVRLPGLPLNHCDSDVPVLPEERELRERVVQAAETFYGFCARTKVGFP